MRPQLRDSFFVSAAALALFGLIRFVFNVVGVRVFGPEFIGVVGSRIAALTVIGVALASVPSVLATKYVAEYRGAGDTERARRLFSGVVMATGLMGLAAAGVLAALGRPTGVGPLVFYVPLFASYVVLKGSYFAFAIQRRYARAEIAGAGAFAVVFAAACLLRSSTIATTSLLAHPLVFGLVAAADHRGYFRVSGGLTELGREWRRYGVYSVATLVNAMNGLGSYHLLVIFAGRFLDAVMLGYLNVLLATLSPLNLLPTAYGAAAFPEMSRRHGEGDTEGLRTLTRRSTIALQALAVLAAGPFLIAPARVFALLHVPAEPGLIAAWCCIAVSLQLNMTSAPSGHVLNATRHVVRHAILSGVFLVLGTVAGLAALSAWGILGAGVMRFALDGPLAWARMALAERSIHWVDGSAARVLVGQLAMLGPFVAAAMLSPPGLTGVLWLIAAASQLPALVDAFRRPAPSLAS